MTEIVTVDSVKIIAPIAFWKTKSFWLGWLPATLTGLDTIMQTIDTPAAVPVANAIAAPLNLIGIDISGNDIATFMKAISPLYALIVAHQRRGVNRPYTANPTTEKSVVEAVVDGKSAFEAGKAIGQQIKR